jgi:hypothetical protein
MYLHIGMREPTMSPGGAKFDSFPGVLPAVTRPGVIGDTMARHHGHHEIRCRPGNDQQRKECL